MMSHLTTVSGGGHVKSMLLKSVLLKLVLLGGWKSALFGDALRLLKVSSFVNNYDPVGVHQAIGDETRCRRCYYDVLEVEVRCGFNLFDYLFLLVRKIINYRTTYITLRGLEFFGRFHLAGLRRIERFDEHLSPQAGKKRQLLPNARLLLPRQNIVNNRQVTAIGRDQVIEALGHAPAFRTWLPVKLLFREAAKHSSRIIRDRVSLVNQTIDLSG